MIGVVNFGGQYNHLIKRRLVELGYAAEFLSPDSPLDSVNSRYDCLVISGGSWNIPEDIHRLGNAPKYVLGFKGPVLGICLGHQLIAHVYGGSLGRGNPEFGGVVIYVDHEDTLLRGLPPRFIAWESHNVEVTEAPRGFLTLAHSDKVKVQAMAHLGEGRFGVQFHPEVKHTEWGHFILRNFAQLCGGGNV